MQSLIIISTKLRFQDRYNDKINQVSTSNNLNFLKKLHINE
jgi:hypothetical protein